MNLRTAAVKTLEFDEIRYDQSKNKWELYLDGKLMYWLLLDRKPMHGDVVIFAGFKGVIEGRLE